MDHYKALGLSRNAGKEDIKAAFRKLAMQFHPDKHSHSPKALREAATRRFKQVSEAYEVLVDDRKRADYNLRYNTTTTNNNYGRRASGFNSSGSNSAGYGYGYNPHSKPNSSYSYRRAANGDGLASKLGIAFHFIARHSILINLTCAGVLLGGTIIIHGRDTLWKMHNAGKSFEDAMESIEKAKAAKDKR